MPSVELDDNKWTQVIGFMSYAPARECMPLINEIGQQLAAYHLAKHPPPGVAAAANGDGKEAPHE